MPDLSGRNAVVTGPSLGGVGWHIARGLAEAGARVILAGRSWEKLDAAGEAIRAAVPGAALDAVALDLADLQSVRAAAEAIDAVTFEAGGPLHILVNNAAAMATAQQRTVDGLDLQMATNHFGPFLLTGLLLGSLATSGEGRIVTQTSLTYRFVKKAPLDFPTVPNGRYAPWRTYGSTKLANMLFVTELARRLEKAALPVMAYASHPGVADSRIFDNGPGKSWFAPVADIGSSGMSVIAQSLEAAALPALMAATAPDLKPGTLIGPRGFLRTRGAPGIEPVKGTATDPDAARALWELSEQTTGIVYP